MTLIMGNCDCAGCTDQDARPDADIDTGSWVIAGSTPESTFWESIDEWPHTSSVDLIHSETLSSSQTSSTCKIGLTTITDQDISTGHEIQWAWTTGIVSGNPTVTTTVELRQGTTLIASGSAGGTSGPIATATYTLTAGEADSITDYSDLQLWMFSVIGPTGSGWGNVYAARFIVTCP